MTIRRIISRRGSFDSRLGVPRRLDNRSDLTLIVKLHLWRMDPPANSTTRTIRDSGQRYRTVRWTDDYWRGYCRDFESMCEMVWNDELYLLPPASLPASVRQELVSHETGASTKPPYIRCQLDIQITARRSESHASLRCYRLADGEPEFRSYIASSAGRDTGIMTNRDIYLEFYSDGGHDRFFSTVAHEVGHVLGLDHPLCSTNSDRCYGTPNTAAYGEVMGFGTTVSTRQASPWTRRIQAHTHVRGGWQATTTQPNQLTLEELLGV